LGGVDSSTEKLLRSIAQARVQNALEEAARVLGSDQEGVTETADKAKTVTAPDAPDSMSSDIKELMHMIREIHHYLDTESGGAGFVPEVLQKWRDYLSRRGVSEALCREMMFQVQLVLPKEQWQDDRRVFAVLKKYILAQWSRTQALDIPALQKQDKPLVIALVGPTGVGKSTTIGKLSAGFSIVESRRVGLITADTYRVAAAEQLRTFGEILGIPVDVVMSASGLAESVARQRDKDVILIDTAGRSPNHVMHMGELAELMKAAQPDLTLLVISATTHPEEQALILEKFRPLSTHLVLTKLDESRCEGAVLDLMTRTDLPLTYLTNGQNVPDDIAVATPERLMGWILGQGAG
jgi:flagellar biosynthesis protein FlhF